MINRSNVNNEYFVALSNSYGAAVCGLHRGLNIIEILYHFLHLWQKYTNMYKTFQDSHVYVT